MYQRLFGLDDVTRTRFAVSPLWELAASLRVLGKASGGFHQQWTDAARTALDRAAVDVRRLQALVPPSGHLADFLTPTPRSRATTIDDELDRVARTPVELVCRDLAMIAAATPGQAAVIDHARKEPHAFLEQVVSDLRCYWAAALEPFWPRLHSLAEADIAWRLERIAAYGARAALADLHPRVELRGSELVVHTTCAAEPAPPGQGMVLVPCAFAWPEILLLDGPTAPPTLGYASRGIGSLWHQPDRPGAELGDLIGRTRATLLHLLDLPATTTQLAAYLQLTAAATNSHLQILHRAGAVTRRRRGRSVFYDRTGLGDALLAGTPQPPT